MEMRTKIPFFLLIAILLNLFCVQNGSTPSPEINAICVVERVVDGDTLWVKSTAGFKENQSFKVRLADIDAFELEEEGGKEAKEFLERLLSNHTTVYLDVDEKSTYDGYGRVIAILYVKANRTHFLNVNRLLVEQNHARWVDYPNSWHPENFRRVVSSEELTSFPSSRAGKNT